MLRSLLRRICIVVELNHAGSSGGNMKDRPRMEQRGSFWLDALLYLVVVGVIILSTANLQAAPIAIDFDTDANGNAIVAGQIIDDE